MSATFIFFTRAQLPRPSKTSKPVLSMMKDTVYLNAAVLDKIAEHGPLVFGYNKSTNQIAFNHDPRGYIVNKKTRCLWTSLKLLGLQPGTKLELMDDVPGFAFVANLPPPPSRRGVSR